MMDFPALRCQICCMIVFVIFVDVALSHRVPIFSTSAVLVQQPTPVLTYHGGPLLSTQPNLPIYVLWYGGFSRIQRRIIIDFMASITKSKEEAVGSGSPSVSSWWKVMASYKDHSGQYVSSSVNVAGQVSDRRYSLGKVLKAADVETLALRAVKRFVADPSALYLVFTSDDVIVEDFCQSQCASHAVVEFSDKAMPYAWVGNSVTQCPGLCAWPFALPPFIFNATPEEAPRGAPNGDIGTDGMVINLATILAGAASNPHGNAYYEGNPEVPLEAATVCAGQFGKGSYPGYPGTLLDDKSSGASFNAMGINQRRYLLPALWDLELGDCRPLP